MIHIGRCLVFEKTGFYVGFEALHGVSRSNVCGSTM